jgi:hypothetical protein
MTRRAVQHREHSRNHDELPGRSAEVVDDDER